MSDGGVTTDGDDKECCSHLQASKGYTVALSFDVSFHHYFPTMFRASCVFSCRSQVVCIDRRERDKTTGFAMRNFGTKKDETKGSSVVK